MNRNVSGNNECTWRDFIGQLMPEIKSGSKTTNIITSKIKTKHIT